MSSSFDLGKDIACTPRALWEIDTPCRCSRLLCAAEIHLVYTGSPPSAAPLPSPEDASHLAPAATDSDLLLLVSFLVCQQPILRDPSGSRNIRRLGAKLQSSYIPITSFPVSSSQRLPLIGSEHQLLEATEEKWIEDKQGDICTTALFQYLDLWDILNSVELNENFPDKHVWRLSPLGQYTAKSAYDTLFHGAISFEPCERIWKSWAPPNADFLCG